MQNIPPDAQPIQVEELLATIGELYLQIRVLRRLLAEKEASPNNAIERQSSIPSN